MEPTNHPQPIDQMSQQNSATAQSSLPTSGVSHRPTRRTVVVIVLLVIVIGIIWYGWYKKNKEMTPYEVLIDLERSSQPVTATPEERKVELDRLEASSTPVEKSYEERMRELNSP